MDIAKKYIHLSGNPDRQAHFVVQRVKANIHAAIVRVLHLDKFFCH